MEKPSVLVVIVLYHPDKNQLIDLITSCCKFSKASVLLFDNAALDYAVRQCIADSVIYFQSSNNVGVAGAYYYACQMAVEKKFDFILLLDQDSQLPPYFISDMLLAFHQLKGSYQRLAAVGPAWRDSRRFKRTRKAVTQQKKMLISSGCLISVAVLKEIGYPKKEYFIDHVDTEWCLRAYSKNYQLVQLQNIQMQHSLGEVKRMGCFTLQYHKPIRYYYTVRNSLFIFKEKQFPFFSRLHVLIRNLHYLVRLPFHPEPIASLLAVLKGLKEGIKVKIIS